VPGNIWHRGVKGLNAVNVIGNGAARRITFDFPLVVHRHHVSILYCLRDTTSYLSKMSNNSNHTTQSYVLTVKPLHIVK